MQQRSNNFNQTDAHLPRKGLKRVQVNTINYKAKKSKPNEQAHSMINETKDTKKKLKKWLNLIEPKGNFCSNPY